jgi:hypothetical protein
MIVSQATLFELLPVQQFTRSLIEFEDARGGLWSSDKMLRNFGVG